MPAILALWALPALAQATSTAPTIVSMVEYSEHLIVGKVLSTELVTGAFGNQIKECGITATVAVIDDLTGRAPARLTVAFRQPPITGSAYFLPLSKGSGDFASDTIAPSRPTEEYRALSNCWSKLPELRADESLLGEIVTVTTGQGNRRMSTQWMYKSSYPEIPAGIATYKLPSAVKRPSLSSYTRLRLMPTVLYQGWST
jgi:hypothetical protein